MAGFVQNQKNGGFVSGANAIIKIGGVMVAVARDVSYNISIPHMPIEACGTLEVIANEPTSYSVSGSFSLYRYTKHIEGELDVGTTAATAGNTIKAYAQSEHLNPGEILFSKTFDLVIQVKDNVKGKDGTVSLTNFFKIANCRITGTSAGLDKRSVQVVRYEFVAIGAGDLDSDGKTLGLTSSQIVNDAETTTVAVADRKTFDAVASTTPPAAP